MDFSNTSDVLALIAIIVALGSAAFQWYLDTHMNKVNLEADYFRALYSEHLLYKLPKARKYINFENKKLVHVDMFLEELNAIRQNSLYFMYADIDFFTDIKIELQKLEDYLIDTGNQIVDEEEQEDVFVQIQYMLEGIYKLFNNKYIGN